ncbi:hypothetical protein DFH09DRAFT_1131262 [Mycena vulgaris]|nr:hypothetical protein DFH09DRAFT_1131262 [Mycena vulgaris]
MPVNPAAIAHGPMLIGVTINVRAILLLPHMSSLGSFTSRDQRWLKSLVAFVFLANLLNTGFAVADLYLALINHFGDFQYLTVSTWHPVIVGTVASSVQMFFAWRVHVLTGKWYLGTLTALLALGQLICAMLMAWKCHEFPAWADFANFTDLIIAWMTTTILVDVTITVILVWYLGHKTGLEGTDQLLDRIIRLTIQTGMLTSAWALMDLILFLTLLIFSRHLIFQIPMVKMYTNSLMSSLNSRSRTNQSKIHADAMDGIHSLGKFANSHGLQKDNNTFRLDTNSRPEVFVHVERHELSDLSRERKTATTTTGEHDVKSGWDDPVSNANAV